MMLNRFRAHRVRRLIRTHPRPLVKIFDRLASTQTYSLRQDFSSPAVVIADRQTQGHGQRDHSFYSPASGIYMTVTLPARRHFLSNPGLLTAGIGTAIVEVLSPLLPDHLGLKWMNDVYYHHRKCGGVLVETNVNDQNVIKAFVIGIGLNLLPTKFPSRIQSRAGYLFHSLPVSKDVIIARIYDQLVRTLGFSAHQILTAYRASMLWQHRLVEFQTAAGSGAGVILGIDSKARLVIRDRQGAVRHLNYRDASQIRLVH